jgi:murein L,D-transpeptidase YafK
MRTTRIHPILITTLIWPGFLNATSADLPGNVFARGTAGRTVIVVDKEQYSASLVEISNDRPRTVRQFSNLLLGENGGDKIKEGDKKTPEGVYHVTSFIPDSELAPKYGSGAFPINYPNPLDRAEEHDGGGIWLHGRDDNDLEKQVTRGCVAFTNDQINDLQGVLQKGTPVIIASQATLLDPLEYESRHKRIFDPLDQFIDHWDSGNVEALGKMIHPEYHGYGGNSKEAWLRRKASIIHHNPERKVEAHDLYAFQENSEQLVFDFDQFYCASNLVSLGRKQLYFKLDQGQLKLVSEQYTPGSAQSLIHKRVSDFLEQWRNNWQKNSLDNYIQAYSEDFRDPKGRDRTAWKEYKQELFAKRSDQTITIDNIRITPLRGDLYRASFRQHYSSGEHSDIGIKTLELQGCPGEFQIISEQWRPRS